VCMEFDTDPDAAAVTRRRVFDMVATDRLAIIGMHLHFPGFAHPCAAAPAISSFPKRGSRRSNNDGTAATARFCRRARFSARSFVRHSKVGRLMSAMGHMRTFRNVRPMSALPPNVLQNSH
jgi:hypothetical protein